MGFEWDVSKAQSNKRKHGVTFTEAATILSDPEVLVISDTQSDPEEERFIGLGMSAAVRLLVVVYTHRGENIRVISARKATESERKEYESQQ